MKPASSLSSGIEIMKCIIVFLEQTYKNRLNRLSSSWRWQQRLYAERSMPNSRQGRFAFFIGSL